MGTSARWREHAHLGGRRGEQPLLSPPAVGMPTMVARSSDLSKEARNQIFMDGFPIFKLWGPKQARLRVKSGCKWVIRLQRGLDSELLGLRDLVFTPVPVVLARCPAHLGGSQQMLLQEQISEGKMGQAGEKGLPAPSHLRSAVLASRGGACLRAPSRLPGRGSLG